MKRAYMVVAAALSIIATTALAAKMEPDIRKGTPEARLDALAAIQPGLGTVMIEYGSRFVDTYYAAKGGNWGLAQYQLKEAREIQEVGEITRPNRASPLKSFEKAFLEPLSQAIEAKDFALFEKRYRTAIGGCNGCHAASGFGFIKYVLPDSPAGPHLDFAVKSDPK